MWFLKDCAKKKKKKNLSLYLRKETKGMAEFTNAGKANIWEN